MEVAAARPYRVTIGLGLLPQLTAPRAPFLLSDENVQALHGARLDALSPPAHLAVPAGEGSKSLATLERVLEAMTAADLDRGSTLVALGGGVVGDLGGLAASLYMRGIDWVACPTTLLAMVDASVGGKTAVNLAAGKNLAGTFWSPQAVHCDLDVLATLPSEELRSGLGEVLKTALLSGEELLTQLESSAASLAEGDPDALADVVVACVRHKALVVAADEREAGPRRALNLGHTFAHAIERVAGYGTIPHGVAVAAGLGLALETSRALGLLLDPDLPSRHAALATALKLPRGLAELRRDSGLALDSDALLSAMRHDKKSRAGAPELVLPTEAGRVELGVAVASSSLSDILA